MISATEWILFLLIFALVLTLAMGVEIHPLFLIISGIAGFGLAFQAYTITSNVLVSTIISIMSVLIMIFGLFHKIPED